MTVTQSDIQKGFSLLRGCLNICLPAFTFFIFLFSLPHVSRLFQHIGADTNRLYILYKVYIYIELDYHSHFVCSRTVVRQGEMSVMQFASLLVFATMVHFCYGTPIHKTFNNFEGKVIIAQIFQSTEVFLFIPDCPKL